MILVENMLTIEQNSVYQYEIKKSKFITCLYKVDSLEEIENLLQTVKSTYKDATHYCYAYQLESQQKCYDDKEPAGTAGIPILEVLSKKNLDHILCIVVRYFGGIKLGASGLIRAYSKAVTEALNQSQTIELVEGYLLEVRSNYQEQKQYDYLFRDNIIDKRFQDKVIYHIEISKDKLKQLQHINYQIIEKRWVKKT